jgi:hypothetical protein
MAGDARAPAHAKRARDLALGLGDPGLMKEAIDSVADVLLTTRRIDAVRVLLEREYEQWHERDEPYSGWVLHFLAWVELWGGRWELAAEYAARGRDIYVQYGIEIPQHLLPMAVVALHRGQLELARELSERALGLAEDQLRLHPPVHLATLGLVALGNGDLSAAAVLLGKADRQAAALAWGEPVNRWWAPTTSRCC